MALSEFQHSRYGDPSSTSLSEVAVLHAPTPLMFWVWCVTDCPRHATAVHPGYATRPLAWRPLDTSLDLVPGLARTSECSCATRALPAVTGACSPSAYLDKA